MSVLLAACSSGEKEVKPAEYLLEKAEKAWAKKKWAKAADFYGQVRDYYPYHTKATLAQFRSAEGLYRSEKYHESLAAFETFDELHPTHEKHPQVLLRIGQSHFRLSRGIDRDQQETHNAIKVLARVLKQFPETKEGKEAKGLIDRATSSWSATSFMWPGSTARPRPIPRPWAGSKRPCPTRTWATARS